MRRAQLAAGRRRRAVIVPRLRILHAIHDFLPRHSAGSELYAYDLASELARRHDVWVLAAEYDPAAPHGQLRWRAHGDVPVIEIVNNWAFETFADTWSSPRIGRQIEHVLHATRPHVVHVHNLLNLSFDLPRLALERGARPVATLHDYTLVCPSGGQRVHVADEHVCENIDPARCARCFRQSPFAAQMAAAAALGRGPLLSAAAGLGRRFPLLFRAGAYAAPATTPGDISRRLAWAQSVLDTFDVMVAPSQAIATEFIRLGAQPSRVEVSGYGSRVRPRASGAAGSGGRVRIAFAGTLIWHKGAHVLIEAARALRGPFEIVIHGDPRVAPAYARSLEDAAAGLPITFPGPFTREQVGDVYGAMDLLVVPSLWPENAPFVIQEARAHGVAVIGARIGGIPEFVRDGVDGALFDPGSSRDLSRVLQEWIDNASHRGAIGVVVPKTIEQDAAEWEARYAHALAGQARPVAAME